MLTHRRAILRNAIQTNAKVHKTVGLVPALARLHSYCIDEYEASCDAAYSTATDEWQNEVSGAVPLVQTPQQYNNNASSAGITPCQLLDGSNRFDDISANVCYNRQRRYNYISTSTRIPLPRKRLHSYVADTGLSRPTPQPPCPR
jgi:hypothetical protein